MITDKLIRPVLNVYGFYRDGFKGMVLGKKLWAIIFIKLFLMFAVLKLFFFPDYLNTKFNTDEEKSNYVLEQITGKTFLKNEQTNTP
ncbi:DUF4492 domain-containing protein [Desulfospira joergensenii]|uniref:DUF4492 domain-containing protein n=1 Tax=Desulfospira joergensenii TaxID=53329 RepID=UPI0003B50DCE|nr:DUF4492 domain-containing protein [Desulfospira joergensenii]